MIKEFIVIGFVIIMIILFLLIVFERTKEIRKEPVTSERLDKLIELLKEYSKTQPDLAKIFNKFGIL